ncbi:transketolase family protein [Planctomycetota bacterium]
MELKCTREAYGQTLIELGKQNPNIVVLCADLSSSCKTNGFAKTFPDRFFNLGVAEANMMNTAAGLAVSGKTLFVSTFAIFATGRVWEQVRNTVAYSGLNVKIVATHSGISVGPDGSSHQAIEDIALMRVIPGMTVVIAVDACETAKAVRAVAQWPGPVYLRLARLKMPVITQPNDPFVIGQPNVLREGKDAVIIACGLMVAKALAAAEQLAQENISVSVLNLHTIKPLNDKTIIAEAKKTGAVVTAEEHLVNGGMGSAVAECLGQHYPVPIEMIGLKDQFGQSGDPEELLKFYHLTEKDIAAAAKKAINRK